MVRRTALVLAVLVTLRGAAFAQPYAEVGATIAPVCLQGEASCADQVAARGWQVGLWLNEKTALRLRYLGAPRPDLIVAESGVGDVRWSSRRRTLWLGEMTWHIGAPRAVRVYAGFSAGVQRDRLFAECAPAVCDVLRARGQLTGRFDSRPHATVGGVAGVSVHPTRRLLIMAGFAAYDLMAEHWGVSGMALQLAYRHPTGR